MTRILSLGQNNGLTLMILNLAPVRSYHLDTLSSLNFANRTKKIEVCEVENEPIFRSQSKPLAATSSITGSNIQRQPLRPIAAAHNANLHDPERKPGDKPEKPVKAFSVYSDTRKTGARSSNLPAQNQTLRRTEVSKRPADSSSSFSSRHTKALRPSENSSRIRTAPSEPVLSKASIEALISQRIDEKLAEKALQDSSTAAPSLSADLQKRLDELEQRIDAKEDGGKAEGLQFLLMAKQHQVRGEDPSALRMYQLALPFFPGNEKLRNKMKAVEERIKSKREAEKSGHSLLTTTTSAAPSTMLSLPAVAPVPAFAISKEEKRHSKARRIVSDPHDDDDDDFTPPPADADLDASYASDDSFRYRPKIARKPTKLKAKKVPVFRDDALSFQSSSASANPGEHTPRTAHLLRIINSRDVSQIRALKGVGAKKADAIVTCLVEMEEDEVRDLESLALLKGVGGRTVENMRLGLAS